MHGEGYLRYMEGNSIGSVQLYTYVDNKGGNYV
ncbi:hypothetical protein HRbin05_00263 [archaeon HR05]|nr:hypothetical protein HRbin05_00263 [archaeon HR05]